MEYFNTKSTFKTLFLNVKIEHIINPWYFEIDIKKEIITVSKRNWYFIGKNSETIAFRFIRKININEHFFGGDILIKAVGVSISAKYLSKSDLNTIRELIIEYNIKKKKSIIIS